ncbi:MAG: thiosulfate oxidation carrier protein SoxY [Betaproteobacteria bacterium]|nr:thiosulfate oxidation carrier protein SoxY [Betaproteobacteria bacterium]
MQETRRSVIRAGGALALLALTGTALLKPGRAHAAWNKSAFEAKSAIDAMKALGMSSPEESRDIVIVAPDIAENGAVVPIEVTSNIPGTTSISVFIEKNPFPYTGTFGFAAGSVPFVHLRAKMGETSPVRVVVAAGGKHYTSAKEVKVTIGGCGG